VRRADRQDERPSSPSSAGWVLSLDWSISYRTIDDHSRATASRRSCATSQRGEAYQSEAPGLWDVTFQTAVAQAELEARDYPGHYHRVAFHGADGPGLHRDHPPRAHPRVRGAHRPPRRRALPALFGTTVTSPLFGVEIPVLAHPAAEMDKGAGIAMCCTFGDLTDVIWWRELQLPTRSIITRTGRLQRETPDWLTGTPGEELYAEQLAGQDGLRRPGGDRRRAAASPATSTASRPRPSAWPTSTSAARSRSRSSPPPVVHPQRRA
jgi:valyl-tRNA synthetase